MVQGIEYNCDSFGCLSGNGNISISTELEVEAEQVAACQVLSFIQMQQLERYLCHLCSLLQLAMENFPVYSEDIAYGSASLN